MTRFFLALLWLPLTVFASESVTYGDWIEGRQYDYRYVTTYNIDTIARPITQYPWIEEDCHDEGQRFANWSQSMSYEIVYNGKISFSYLGFGLELGGERSKVVEYTFQRWVVPTKGIRARHTLHEQFENWSGTTTVEYRYADGSVEKGEKTYPFNLTKMNYGLFVKRQILEVCAGY